MKTFVLLFCSSALFGVTIAVAYFFVAHEETVGTLLLGVMTAALTFTASYALIAEREAHLEGDDSRAESAAVSGEDLGVFTARSALPILLATCLTVGLIGVIFSPFLATLALIGTIWCLWRLGAESARV